MDGAAELPAEGAPRFQAPSGWEEQAPEHAMRLTQFQLEGPGSPILVVHYWPNGVGGLEANLDRWRGSVQGGEPCQVETTHPNGLEISLLTGEGQVSDGMGGEPSQGGLMAAYVSSPSGRFPGVYTLKANGPAATLRDHLERMRTFLANL